MPATSRTPTRGPSAPARQQHQEPGREAAAAVATVGAPRAGVRADGLRLSPPSSSTRDCNWMA